MTSPLLKTIAQSAVAGVTPISAPAAHDVFKVTGPSGSFYSPPCKIVECNGRESIAQEQQAPGYTGAILVIRGTHLVSVSYEITLWDANGFKTYAPLIAALKAAQNARPQQSLVLTDLRLRDLVVPRVTPIVIPHQQLQDVGKWTYKIRFMENARLKLAGGPVQPPRNAREVQIQQLEGQIAAQQQRTHDAYVNAAKNAGKS